MNQDPTQKEHDDFARYINDHSREVGGGGLVIPDYLLKLLAKHANEIGAAFNLGGIVAQHFSLDGSVVFSVEMPGRDKFENVNVPCTAECLLPFLVGIKMGIGLLALCPKDASEVYESLKEDTYSDSWQEAVKYAQRTRR